MKAPYILGAEGSADCTGNDVGKNAEEAVDKLVFRGKLSADFAVLVPDASTRSNSNLDSLGQQWVVARIVYCCKADKNAGDWGMTSMTRMPGLVK